MSEKEEPYIFLTTPQPICSMCSRPVYPEHDGEPNAAGWTPLKAVCPAHGEIYGVLPPTGDKELQAIGQEQARANLPVRGPAQN